MAADNGTWKPGDLLLCIDGKFRLSNSARSLRTVLLPVEGRTYVFQGYVPDVCNCIRRIYVKACRLSFPLPFRARCKYCNAVDRISANADTGFSSKRFIKIGDTDLNKELEKEEADKKEEFKRFNRETYRVLTEAFLLITKNK